jgi:hypothetical protein
MAEEPTRAEAEAALGLLKDLIDEFPFVNDVARSVALAGLMTPVLRGAFRVAPLFFIHKPEAGTGASYLVEVISCLATGRRAPPMKASSDPKELTKELSAAAFEAKPILNLNNLSFDLASSDLAQMVTEGVLDVRPFGRNDELRSCDCRAMTIFANGNNIVLVGELIRRSVTCRIDAKMESPELGRKFNHRPVDEVLADRANYLAAVFTMARGYKTAGEPKIDSAASVNGFEEWSRWVQRPLMWLGEADPFASQEGARDQDPERSAFRARINALVKYGHELGGEYSASDIHGLAMQPSHGAMGQYERQDLFDAFSRNGRISVQSIQVQLRRDLSRRAGAYHLELAGKDRKTHNTYKMYEGDKPMGKDQAVVEAQAAGVVQRDPDEPPM